MHPRMQARVKDVATQKMLSREETIVLKFKTIALISEIEFTNTGIQLFRMLSDVTSEIVRDLSNLPPNTTDGLSYRKKIRDELRSLQGNFETLAATIQNLNRIRSQHQAGK